MQNPLGAGSEPDDKSISSFSSPFSSMESCDHDAAIGRAFVVGDVFSKALLDDDALSQQQLLASIGGIAAEDFRDPAALRFAENERAVLPLLMAKGSPEIAREALELIRASYPGSLDQFSGVGDVLCLHPGLPAEKRDALKQLFKQSSFSEALVGQYSSASLGVVSEVERDIVQKHLPNPILVEKFNSLIAKEAIEARELSAPQWARRLTCVNAICAQKELVSAGTVSVLALALLLEPKPVARRSALSELFVSAAENIAQRPAWLFPLLAEAIPATISSSRLGILGRQEPILRPVVVNELLARIAENRGEQAYDAIESLYWSVSTWGVVSRVSHEHGISRLDIDSRDVVFLSMYDYLSNHFSKYGDKSIALMIATALAASTSKVSSVSMTMALLDNEKPYSDEVRRTLTSALVSELPSLVDPSRYTKKITFTPMSKVYAEGLDFLAGMIGASKSWFWGPEAKPWREGLLIPALKSASLADPVFDKKIAEAIKGPGQARQDFARLYFR